MKDPCLAKMEELMDLMNLTKSLFNTSMDFMTLSIFINHVAAIELENFGKLRVESEKQGKERLEEIDAFITLHRPEINLT